ncbi:sulfate ABC transporter permease subunit CysT [Bacillus sp. NPDC077027]|uniref:sulfate ABC transporter permease subunit CysT n=1 Tax=Bacillus sp. NPDC077027 TaxID=3390548 RepID=UPI003CFE5490
MKKGHVAANKKTRFIPGFGMSLGITLVYLSAIVIIPLSMVFIWTASLGGEGIWNVFSDPRVVKSLQLTISTSFFAAITNVVFGVLIAWVLVRYAFPGQRVVDALIDLPFALPTAVAGIALTTLYSPNGWIGQFLYFKVAYTPIGIVLALVFIGIPFVIRTVQPVIEGLEREVEEASAVLGATRGQTFFKVLLPTLFPATMTGFSLAFARSLGEYGSVVFIAGNIPFKTEITPLIIMTKLEQYDYKGASAVACMMLLLSFLILLIIHLFQWYVQQKKRSREG